MIFDHDNYNPLGVGLPTLIKTDEFSAISEGEYILTYLGKEDFFKSVSTARIGNLGMRGTRKWRGIEAISSGAFHAVGLRKDGKGFATGDTS